MASRDGRGADFADRERRGLPGQCGDPWDIAAGRTLRPQVRITAGRVFRAGLSEIIVGGSICWRFGNVRISASPALCPGDWTVVGHFDAGGSGLDPGDPGRWWTSP